MKFRRTKDRDQTKKQNKTVKIKYHTVKMKVFTPHHFVPIHTLFLFLVCVLGQFSV